MARRTSWIVLAMAIPATVAFTPGPLPGPPPGPPPPAEPQVVAPARPVVAMAPVAASPAPAAPAPAAPAPAPAAAPARHLPPGPASLPAPPPRDVGRIVVDAALTRLGAPYAWGAAGPDAFDCSGLVMWAFKQAGVNLPHSSQALASGGQPVAVDQMQPGDVISLFPDASHVGIYVGGGRMVHASFEGTPVAVESLFRAPIHNVRRYS